MRLPVPFASSALMQLPVLERLLAGGRRPGVLTIDAAALTRAHLLAVGALKMAEPGLKLPHPGLHQRNCVLYPLSEIAAELWVPGLARVCRLRERISPAGIERLAARGSGDD